jgi:glycosyltransferase involved in cell wall biosynthesis
MNLSVIVATYNRKDELKDLLDSFADQSLSPDQFELIVVDDGSTDGTDRFVTDYAATAPYTVRYHYQENRGPGRARTEGMQRAAGDVFIFIDSDCLAPRHYLETIAREFENSDIDAFGGPDRSAPMFSAWDKAVNFTMNSFLTTGGLRGTAGKRLARYYPRSFNMGLRRWVFESVGGFGSIYQYGEDIEYSRRIIQTGADVSFLGDAYVYHKRRTSPGGFARQVFKMGRGRIQLCRINSSMLEPLHLIPLALLLFAAALFTIAFLYPEYRTVIAATAVGAAAGVLFIGIQGAVATRTPMNAIFVPVALLIQIAAYGLGMLAELLFGKRRRNKK